MAQPSTFLIEALHKTADKLTKGVPYQWGHMGSCNCGNLAQEITQLSKAEIHEYALQTRFGDWSEQTSEFCPTSNLPMDIVISEMLNAGLTRTDLKHLEKLSDKQVLKRLPANNRYLIHNKRDDVVKYLRTWADLLEEQLLEKINIKNVVVPAKVLV
ncbi:hypothetical protein [uncultured Microscilla sp.]|uniref:hypothetical protein n=1 Tax=uncultured Microscilla sp. TaxID=432653 RepID=UPI00262EC536|nr:hypothetical protein [uncultured Microscilla sp.]